MANDKKSNVGTLWTNVLNAITGNFPEKEFEDKSMLAKEKTYDPNIRDQLLLTMKEMQIRKPDNNIALPFLNTIMEKNVTDTQENERLIQMCPEISLSALIMVSSILSPNDMRVGIINIRSECPNLTPDKNQSIEKYLSKFFEERLNLSTSLPKWIYNAMYRAGATPLLTVPLKTLLDEIDNKNNYIEQTSTEAMLSLEQKWEKESKFGFSTENEEFNPNDKSYLIAIEKSFNTSFVEKYDQTPPKINQDHLATFAKSILSKEDLTILDNPNAFTGTKVKNKVTKVKNKNKAKREYLPQEFLGLPDPERRELNEIYDNPIFMELPYESVIPIYTPGTPSDHIGYFVMLDERGHPITDASIAPSDSPNIEGKMQSFENSQRSAQIAGLFQAQGYSGNSLFEKVPVRQMMEEIYQSVIEYHLTAKTMQAGYANVGLGSNPSLYRAMFSRYLSARKTKVMFVPKEFLTYLCFEHGKDGCGVSKLANMKWITSLHVSLTTARMLQALNNSINRQRVIINTGETQMGNLVQLMRIAQQQAIAKNIWDFTSNPAYMCSRIAEQGVSVEVRGANGLSEFSVERDTDTRAQAIRPDEELSERIKNSLILSLEVPAAALNNVGENEYSRSVATSNIIFSRRLSVYQKSLTQDMNEFLRNYTRYSKEILTNIQAIIDDKDDQKKNDYYTKSGTIEENKGDMEDLESVINHLTIHLPDPTLAPDNAQLENVTATLNTLNALIEATHDEGTMGSADPGTQVGINVTKGIMKREAIKNLIKNTGLSEDLISLLCQEISSNTVLQTIQEFDSLGAALKQQSGLFRAALSDQQFATQSPPPTDPNAGQSQNDFDQQGGQPPTGDDSSQDDSQSPQDGDGLLGGNPHGGVGLDPTTTGSVDAPPSPPAKGKGLGLADPNAGPGMPKIPDAPIPS